MEIHGQHEGQLLRSSPAQTRFLDRSAGGEHLRAVEALAREHDRLGAARASLAGLDERERERERELDLLAYQVREIGSVAPRPGEIAELRLEGHASLRGPRPWLPKRARSHAGSSTRSTRA